MAASIGAIVPDAMMFVFYAVEKLVLQSSEKQIWSERYFASAWQNIFDSFNSIPIVMIALGIAWWTNHRWSFVFLASMLIHFALDLPLHHDDGHRHFFPFWDWRFASPISYWDPKHFGIPAAIGEVVLSGIAWLAVFPTEKRFWARAMLIAMLGLELLMLAGLLVFVFYA